MKRFQLETAIAAWRRTMRHREVILPEDLDELEQHLRDQIAELGRQGVDASEAFERALAEMGDPAETERAFNEVYWPKLHRKGLLIRHISSQAVLFRGYLKAAARSLLKRKGYAAVNVIGLAVGIAASLLITQYVSHERAYDEFHQDAERIYRVRQDVFRGSELLFAAATTYPAVGPTAAEMFTEVESFTRMFMHYGGGVVRAGDQIFNEELIFSVDSTFFSVFSYPILHGDRARLLNRPQTAVISSEMALKYFGEENPVGQSFTFANGRVYEVVGVAASPEQSHFAFNFLLTFDDDIFADGFQQAPWSWYDFYTYLKLRPGANPEALEARFPEMIALHKGKASAAREVMSLQRLTDIHLHSDLLQEARTNGSAITIYVLAAVAAVILLIAWINYINLSTARAAERAREIGVRKAVGARRQDLVRQFMLEAGIVNAAACVLAIGLSAAALPFFSNLAGIDLEYSRLADVGSWAAVAAFLILGSFGAGLYPAVVLASYKPSIVLRGVYTRSSKGVSLRKGLVLVQFSTSVALIAGTIIAFQQIDYMRSRDLGIEIDQVLVIDGPGVVQNDSVQTARVGNFKEELLKHPGILHVSATSEIPGNLIYWTSGARRLRDGSEDSFTLYRVGVDEAYFETFEHHLVAGRFFSRDHPRDSERIIINERALSSLGMSEPNAAIGERLRIGGDTLEVLGVVEDYHHEGLQKGFDPIAFHFRPQEDGYFAVRFEHASTEKVIAAAERAFAVSFPANPFSYEFLDDHFNRQYTSYQRLGAIFGFFALLALLVGALGLSGLAAFTAYQRTKEIAIRKVLGANVSNILVLLAREYLVLIAIAGAVATPVIWVVMNRWLDGFAFRLQIEPWPFLLALLTVAVIAAITVALQSIRVATTNPARSIRAD